MTRRERTILTISLIIAVISMGVFSIAMLWPTQTDATRLIAVLGAGVGVGSAWALLIWQWWHYRGDK